MGVACGERLLRAAGGRAGPGCGGRPPPTAGGWGLRPGCARQARAVCWSPALLQVSVRPCSHLAKFKPQASSASCELCLSVVQGLPCRLQPSRHFHGQPKSSTLQLSLKRSKARPSSLLAPSGWPSLSASHSLALKLTLKAPLHQVDPVLLLPHAPSTAIGPTREERGPPKILRYNNAFTALLSPDFQDFSMYFLHSFFPTVSAKAFLQ